MPWPVSAMQRMTHGPRASATVHLRPRAPVPHDDGGPEGGMQAIQRPAHVAMAGQHQRRAAGPGGAEARPPALVDERLPAPLVAVLLDEDALGGVLDHVLRHRAGPARAGARTRRP